MGDRGEIRTHDEGGCSHLLGISLLALGVRDGGDVGTHGLGEHETEVTIGNKRLMFQQAKYGKETGDKREGGKGAKLTQVHRYRRFRHPWQWFRNRTASGESRRWHLRKAWEQREQGRDRRGS
jgi:hypothetical protein